MHTSVCRSDIISLILSVLEIKMVSGRRGLKVSQKPLIILVKLSHQNSFPHIHPRAMWSDWCQYNADAQPVSSGACGAVFVMPDTGHQPI